MPMALMGLTDLPRTESAPALLEGCARRFFGCRPVAFRKRFRRSPAISGNKRPRALRGNLGGTAEQSSSHVLVGLKAFFVAARRFLSII